MEMEKMMKMMQGMCQMDGMNTPEFMKDMPMPDPEIMKHRCKMMGKGDFASAKLCQDFMEIFKEK